MKKFTHNNTSFVCANCGIFVPTHRNGSCRNHCNSCLYSLHVDINPGDRNNGCTGLMKPVQVMTCRTGYKICHECLTCGEQKWNIAALDDSFSALLEVVRALPEKLKI